MKIKILKTFKIRNPSTGKFEPLLAIKGEKGDVGGLSNITQEFGTSEDLVISQKIVSDAINTATTSASNAETAANYAKTLADSMKESWVKIASGTYTGDGTSTNTIKFDFTPVFLRIDRFKNTYLGSGNPTGNGIIASPDSIILSGDMNQSIFIDTFTDPYDTDERNKAVIYCKTSLDTDNTLSLSRVYWATPYEYKGECEWYNGVTGPFWHENIITENIEYVDITTTKECFNASGSTYRYFAIGI